MQSEEATLGDRLRQAWQVARGGRGGVLHLEAPVGRGKSTILSRFLDEVGGPSERVAVVSARCGEGPAPGGRGVVEELALRVAEGVRAIDAGPERDDVAEAEVPWLLPGADFVTAATEIASLPRAEAGPAPPSRAAIHAGLLIDVSRLRPVMLVLDDVHRADPASRALVEALTDALAAEPDARLLLVMASSPPLDGVGAPWRPAPGAVIDVPPMDHEALADLVRGRMARYGGVDPGYLDRVLAAGRGNPLVVDALVQLSERGGAFAKGRTDDPDLARRPGFEGLSRLAAGALPALPANVRADLQAAAVVGPRFETALLARLWSVPEDAARLRIDALRATGLVAPEGDRWCFISAELAAHYADTLPPDARARLHVRVATLLRANARAMTGGPADGPRPFLDVTETWSETRRRDRRVREELALLSAAAAHFGAAGRHIPAAEAGVTLVERLFETSGGHTYLAGRFGRRADRERRHRIYAALTEATARLERVEAQPEGPTPDSERLAIHVRLSTMRARFKEVLGDFTEARHHADAAVELARHLPDPRVRLEAMRVRLEVCYAAGDANAAREVMVQLTEALARAPRAEAVRIYTWLVEALGRWEWVGLHERLFPYIIERLQALDAHREALRARLEWMSATVEGEDPEGPERLVDELVAEAAGVGETPYVAEQLARYAAELIQSRVDAHFDLLSGEFYPPDLYGEGVGPAALTLGERLQRPIALMQGAADLVGETDSRVSLLRVMTTTLGVVYETRERFAQLLDRWMPVHGEDRPMRLLELVDALERGFFSVERVEALTRRTAELATDLDLQQVVADTLYEALDRDLPMALRQAESLFPRARAAYAAVGDVYGLITLALVRVRHLERRGQDPSAALEEGLSTFAAHEEQLNPEQRAFVHLRYGELFLDRTGETDEAIGHLEHAIRLYDRVGDVEHVQAVGEVLRELYRKQGDFGRYRALRERFRPLEFRSPGVDPLGLELRIEHLLNLARQEPDDEQAIHMVERCVQLFGRMPDGTTRIDECFVEISKICRRRADEASTEAGFADWLRRSLEAVRIAASINRGLGNFHRVFEEYHELFDDLLGLGALDDYLRTRAESRELAFAVGHVGELLYLFEEHLQYDPDGEGRVIRLPEVRGFYEALLRYLLGLGAVEHALRIQNSFVNFLTELDETELAELYRARRLAPSV